MRTILILVVSLLVACGGAGAVISDFDASPDAVLKVEPDADAPDATGDSSVPADGGPDGEPDACPGTVDSGAPGALCGPDGFQTLCGTSGRVYVCQGAVRPALAGCVSYSQRVDDLGKTYTRTFCPEDVWLEVPDPTQLCIPSIPRRFYAPSAGGIGPGVCVAAGSWSIDGTAGRIFCCP